jgi:hypothetical protein
MTEQEWLENYNPNAMLRFAWERGLRSGRKHRLFVCSVCRLRGLPADRGWKAVEVVERYVDGRATDDELRKARTGARVAARVYSYCNPSKAVVRAVRPRNGDDDEATRPGRSTYVCIGDLTALVLDIFGCLPFRAVAVKPAWRTRTVKQLARAAYEERELPVGYLDPLRLAVLGDALEDAGCTDADILVHLRSKGRHVRGCWALDLVLGKEGNRRVT